MTGWLKNNAPQHFMISFGLAAFVGLMISIILVAFVEGIAWVNGKLLITPHAHDAIGKIRQKNTATAKPAPL